MALARFSLAMPVANDIPNCSSAAQQVDLALSSHIRGLSNKSFPRVKKTVSKKGTVMKFFHLINETGAEIKVRVLVDDRELFVKRIQAKLGKSEGIVHPAADQYPTLELKIPLSNQARQLSIHELLVLKKSKAFVISSGTNKDDAGFQIVIRKDGIKVTQDYYPIL